jgi:N utilization substance protein A
MAREAGHRTKIAVSSIDSKVDAVGACVGVRGSRIKNIVDELNGEKIDIVRWNESSQILIQNALKPAIVSEISLCFELGRATVVVQEDQLSLAIGKRGQNVRLAARLTGWDVDILTPDEFNKGLEIMADTLSKIEGVSEEMLDKLAALGIVSVFDVEEVGADVLVNEAGVEAALAQTMVEAASAQAKIVAEQQERDKAEAEVRKRAEEEAARRLISGDLPADADADLRAAAILGAGAIETTMDPARFESLSAGGDARAEAILSGADPVPEWKDEANGGPAGEPADGYDPDEAAEAPSPSDADEDEGREIVENTVNEEIRRGASGG